ncbi:amidase [Ectothiorhodospiraceae bacterium WFHF3C12]|nr:amidase [Ectothiorhodospiraceae bacterium WFHF3C12]
MKSLERLNLSDLARGFRDQSLSPEAVAEHCGERHERFDETLGAYRAWNAQLAAEAGLAGDAFRSGLDLGPLQGIPVSVKDLYGVPGYRTYAGSPRALPAAWERPGPVLEAVRRQLAPVAGKTHTVEFAYGGLGTNPHWGAPRNPWAAGESRVPGGSSSGAGVSLLEGSALLAFGTDTAGSVRIPASMTGTVGLKTTAGRWSLEGIVPLSTTTDTPGILTRSVADSAWAFRAIERGLGRDATVPRIDVDGLRVGVPEAFFWEDCSPGVAEAVRQALRELEQAGARLHPADMSGPEEAFGYFRNGGLTTPEFYRFLRQELPEWLETLDANVRQRMEAASEAPAWAYLQLRHRLEELGREAATLFERLDVLAVPAVAVTPPTLSELEPEGAYPSLNMLALRNTSIASMFGLCALSVPAGLDPAGMPVGLMLMAAPHAEERLLAVGAAVERCLGTAAERLGRPPMLRD